MSLLNLSLEKKIRGVWVFVTPALISLCKNSAQWEPWDKVPVLYVILCAQYFCFFLRCVGVLFAAYNSFVQAVCWSFVCSVREFCLQRVILLFAACWSFVCSVQEFCLQGVILLFAVRNSFVGSVLEFCLQCAGVLFAACNSFACSVHVFFYSFFFVSSVQEMIFLACYLCLQGIFLFAVFSLC